MGNVVNPYELLENLQSKGLTKEQAIDALRYYLLREIPTFEDGDYTWEKFLESYNANLANGIGNLTSRILKMAVNAGIKNYELGIKDKNQTIKDELDVFTGLLSQYEIQKACDWLWSDVIKKADAYIQSTEPFKTIKTDSKKANEDILHLLNELYLAALALESLLPSTSKQILIALGDLSEKNIPRLFPRIDS